MSERFAALLRGVNVGGRRRVAMVELREALEASGYGEVRTLLNSGNVVFTAPRGAAASHEERIERILAERLGISARVTVLSGAELAEALREHPLEGLGVDPSRLLLAVLRDADIAERLAPLIDRDWAPEAFALRGRIAYLACVNGVAGSPLAKELNRAGQDGVTARNLRTMTGILALVARV